MAGKRVIVQGWGNVGSAAAYYLAQAGARVVGIIDRDRRAAQAQGLQLREVRELFLGKQGNSLAAESMMSFDEINRVDLERGRRGLPALRGVAPGDARAGGPLVAGGLEVVGSGANVPFADSEIFYGPIYEYADSKVAVIPDFIANCGMARAFAFLMQGDVEISDEAIFSDVSTTIASALQRCHTHYPERTQLARTAFEVTLGQLV